MAVGDAAQRFYVLVDDEDRQAGRLQFPDRAVDLVSDERREALGRLVEDQQPRIGQERPADGEHLLLAARELVAVVRLPLAQLREKREHALERPGAATLGSRDEVLPHAEVREHLAPLRYQPKACLRDAIRGHAMQRFAREYDRAGLRHADAHDRLHRRGLAHAVAAKQAHDLRGLHLQVDAEEHLAAPISGLDVAQLEHHASSPRYAARTSALARIASGAPVAMTRPYTSTEMRSARRKTASMSCSTSTML